ncbi:hypothetical protein [Xylanimonas ulmi]|uniref:Alternate signal-mediated exported protein n=1 Tax=Xylanimonas ulmi TaxID=228973 RepID=A0A4Q7M4T9_9MICO|nr:hypothetical protein [Xylanibacterium ulmi]RZS62033.1 alternate signal-mediated exported protein [Xylanibacterium ulmi]
MTRVARGPHTRRARRALAIAVVLALLGAAAHALWRSHAGYAGATVHTGDLRVTTLGEPQWRRVVPGGPPQPIAAPSAEGAQFVAMPGDVYTITQPVTTYLRGDNLAGALAVSARPEAGAAVDVTFHVEDASGGRVAPASGGAALGTKLAVPGLVGSDSGVTGQWRVVIEARVRGDLSWSPGGTVRTPWAVQGVDVTLHQVRAGHGFTAAGGVR